MTGKRRLLRGLSISGGIVLGHARVILPGESEMAEVAIATTRLTQDTEALYRAVEQTVS